MRAPPVSPVALLTVALVCPACLGPLALGAPCASDDDCDGALVCALTAGGDGVCAPAGGVEGEGEGEGEGDVCVDVQQELLAAANRTSVAAAAAGATVGAFFADSDAATTSGAVRFAVSDAAAGTVGAPVTIDSSSSVFMSVLAVTRSPALGVWGVLWARTASGQPPDLQFRTLDDDGQPTGPAHGVATGGFDLLENAFLLPHPDGFTLLFSTRVDVGGAFAADSVRVIGIGAGGVGGSENRVIEDAVITGVPVIDQAGTIFFGYSLGNVVEDVARVASVDADDVVDPSAAEIHTTSGVIGAQALPASDGLYVMFREQSASADELCRVDACSPAPLDVGVRNYGQLTVSERADGVYALSSVVGATSEGFVADLVLSTGQLSGYTTLATGHDFFEGAAAAVPGGTAVLHTKTAGTVDEGVELRVLCGATP